MSEIQAVYGLTSDGWTATEIRAWLNHEDLKPIKRVHKVGTELRYRIRNPGKYSRFRTKRLPNGLYLALGFR